MTEIQENQPIIPSFKKNPPFILRFPEDISKELLKWIPVQDLMRLDVAITSHQFRTEWKNLLKTEIGIHYSVTKTKAFQNHSIVQDIVQVQEDLVALGSVNRKITLWNIATDHVLQFENDADIVHGFIRLFDGRIAFCSDMEIKIWNFQLGICERAVNAHEGAVNSLVLLQDGRFASASDDGTVKVWNPEDLSCTLTLIGEPNRNFLCVIQAIDGHLVVYQWGVGLLVWNIETQVCIRDISFTETFIFCMKQLSSGSVATGTSSGTIFIWDPITWTIRQTLIYHKQWVYNIIQLKDDRILAVSGDHTVSLWSNTRDEPVQVLTGHSMAVMSAIEDSHGRIITGGEDNYAIVWSPHSV